jgi:hypothetical protein
MRTDLVQSFKEPHLAQAKPQQRLHPGISNARARGIEIF